MTLFPCCIVLFLWLFPRVAIGDIKGDKSPYYQYLPDCRFAAIFHCFALYFHHLLTVLFSDSKKRKKDYPDIVKNHKDAKGILCPMIRDEEGFLSEWVAYYQVNTSITSLIIFFGLSYCLGAWIQSYNDI